MNWNSFPVDLDWKIMNLWTNNGTNHQCCVFVVLYRIVDSSLE